jgi:DNA-binding CsgD family transcriptional regulator
MPKDTSVGFPELLTQLRIGNRLLAAGLKTSMKQVELIALLASTGASNKEIADVLDTTPDTVKSALKRIRKKAANGSVTETETAQASPEASDA